MARSALTIPVGRAKVRSPRWVDSPKRWRVPSSRRSRIARSTLTECFRSRPATAMCTRPAPTPITFCSSEPARSPGSASVRTTSDCRGNSRDASRRRLSGWADQMAPAMVGHLGNGVRSRRAPAADKHLRQGALDSLDTLDSVADARIARIARTARDLLGATGGGGAARTRVENASAALVERRARSPTRGLTSRDRHTLEE